MPDKPGAEECDAQTEFFVCTRLQMCRFGGGILVVASFVFVVVCGDVL